MLHRTRALLTRQQTMLANALRAHLAEFGIVVAQGIRHVRALIERVFGEGAGTIDLPVLAGLPERFPKLKVLWIESGLAWVPFMMQRLDHEFVMRQSDAPLLKKLPSDYMREMFYTSQPIEITDPGILEGTFRAINAETQLLYSSDWPHWDFDTPGRIAGIPFLSETARRNILGETANRIFNLEPERTPDLKGFRSLAARAAKG